MKFIAFTDLHGDLKRLKHLEGMIKVKKPDMLICAGDFTLFGRNIDSLAKKLNDFKIPIVIIPGNHETGEEVKAISKKYKNIINIHHLLYEKDGYTFLGMGLGGFSRKNREFEKLFPTINKKINPKTKLIVVSHAPVADTATDDIDGEHAGSFSLRKFVELTKPVLVVVGHLHECEHTEDKVKNSRIINPGDGEFVTI